MRRSVSSPGWSMMSCNSPCPLLMPTSSWARASGLCPLRRQAGGPPPRSAPHDRLSQRRTEHAPLRLDMTQELTRLVDDLRQQEAIIRQGGGPKAAQRQHDKGRLTARERIDSLLDPGSAFHELGLWAAWGMYKEWGGAPSAGVVTGVGTVSDRRVMIIANDATVKAGAFFPMTCKKVLRAQRIALESRLPLVYLVDSAGVF